VLANAVDDGHNTTITSPDHSNTVTLLDVTKAQLQLNHDFLIP
jgi:hypothetical protein